MEARAASNFIIIVTLFNIQQNTHRKCKDKYKFQNTTFWLKVSGSQNKIVEPYVLTKNELMNLFFYPDDSEILETWIMISSFMYIRVIRIEKQIHLFVFGRNYGPTILFSRSTDL